MAEAELPGEKVYKTDIEASELASTHKSNSLLLTILLWTVTLVGAALSTSYWILLLFTSFGLPRAQIWLKISQPVIAFVLSICMSDRFGKLWNLQHQHLPKALLRSAPIVCISASALSSGLYIVHAIKPAFDYAGEHRWLVFVVGLVQGYLLFALWGGACGLYMEDITLAQDWLEALTIRDDPGYAFEDPTVAAAFKELHTLAAVVALWSGILLSVVVWAQLWVVVIMRRIGMIMGPTEAFWQRYQPIIAILLLFPCYHFGSLPRRQRHTQISPCLLPVGSVLLVLSSWIGSYYLGYVTLVPSTFKHMRNHGYIFGLFGYAECILLSDYAALLPVVIGLEMYGLGVLY